MQINISTIGAQEQYILDLNGTRWHSNTYKVVQYYRNEEGEWVHAKTCGDYPEGTGMYSIESYHEDYIAYELSDYFEMDICTTTSTPEKFNYPYSRHAICPTRYCKYSDLNQIGEEFWDTEDNRQEQVTKRHVPGSNEVLTIKTITYTPGYGHGDGYTKSVLYTLSSLLDEGTE